MNPSYDRSTIVLHWASAILVVLMWLAGQTIDLFPKGAPRIGARSLHICAGVVLALILVVRIGWRIRGGARLPSQPGFDAVAARTVHGLLYLLLAAVVIAGFACVWIRGDTIFGLFTVPAFRPGDTALRHNAVDLHGLLANCLLALAGVHALAALWHQFVRKDQLLRRMWPSLKRYQ